MTQWYNASSFFHKNTRRSHSLLEHLHGRIISNLSVVHISWSNGQTCWHHMTHHLRNLKWWPRDFGLCKCYMHLYTHSTSQHCSQPIVRHCNSWATVLSSTPFGLGNDIIQSSNLVIRISTDKGTKHTVDGWNPANHLGWCWNPINNGINYQPQQVNAGFQGPINSIREHIGSQSLLGLHRSRGQFPKDKNNHLQGSQRNSLGNFKGYTPKTSGWHLKIGDPFEKQIPIGNPSFSGLC